MTETHLSVHWVVCGDWANGPYTPDAAQRTENRHNDSACKLPHRVVTSGVKPSTESEIAPVRAEWDQPFLADPSDDAAFAARQALTVDLAALILRAPLPTRAGGLTIYTGGWSREHGDAAAAAGEPGSAAWITALGAYEHATLTGDGKAAQRDGWCHCPGQPADSWVPYESWTAAGRVAHGFVCQSCRALIQVG